jgi:phage shock protein A
LGIFQRIGQLIRANLNALLTRAEDPEKLIAQALDDMRGQLIGARTQVGVAIADERRLQKQLEAELFEAGQWEQKAMLAVRAGDDRLAREALSNRDEHRRLATEWGEQFQKQHQAVEHLKTSLRVLNDRIEQTRRKKNLLIARLQRAEAQKQIQQALRGVGDVAAFDVLDRLSDRVDRLEAEAEAEEELALDASGDALSRRFKALETQSVDDALAELKLRMGQEGASGSLGFEATASDLGRPTVSEELRRQIEQGDLGGAAVEEELVPVGGRPQRSRR